MSTRVDVDKFRALAKGLARRLDSLPALDPNVDRITEGRISGIHAALSFLDECVIRDG